MPIDRQLVASGLHPTQKDVLTDIFHEHHRVNEWLDELTEDALRRPLAREVRRRMWHYLDGRRSPFGPWWVTMMVTRGFRCRP